MIDELYPRQKVLEQIHSVTPNKGAFKAHSKRSRITSAGKTRYHLGPQKTLLQKYEKLDHMTKATFNMHFMQTLEQAKQSMGQLLQQHVDLEESSKAINSVFPDHQFFGHEQQILEEV